MLFDKIQLEKDEVILSTVRKHWFIIFSELFGVFIVALLPLFILFIVFGLNTANIVALQLSEYSTFIAFGISAWMFFCLLSAFTIWTHYYLDLWVVTDRRIILVDQIHFFNRNVSIFRLERMQDIEFKITGILPTLLNFGTLKAQTAGAHESNFVSTGLPDPRGLQATIQQAMDDRIAALHIAPDEIAIH